MKGFHSTESYNSVLKLYLKRDTETEQGRERKREGERERELRWEMRNDNSIIDHDRVSCTPFIMLDKSLHHELYVTSNLKTNIWWYTQMKDQINNNNKYEW